MYVTGLTDGEGSFIVTLYQRGKSWTVRCSFELHSRDLLLLHKLQSFFKVGKCMYDTLDPWLVIVLLEQAT